MVPIHMHIGDTRPQVSSRVHQPILIKAITPQQPSFTPIPPLSRKDIQANCNGSSHTKVRLMVVTFTPMLNTRHRRVPRAAPR